MSCVRYSFLWCCPRARGKGEIFDVCLRQSYSAGAGDSHGHNSQAGERSHDGRIDTLLKRNKTVAGSFHARVGVSRLLACYQALKSAGHLKESHPKKEWETLFMSTPSDRVFMAGLY
jgi:hypothetical protein